MGYDSLHQLIEQEEERKCKVEYRLAELDNTEKEVQEQLSALQASNAELEREINEWKSKVQALENGNFTASNRLSYSSGPSVDTKEEFGSRSFRGSSRRVASTRKFSATGPHCHNG